MPCDTGITEEVKKLRNETLKDFEVQIALGKVVIVRNSKGELAVSNWNQTSAAKAGWCEGCCLRSLQQHGNWVTKSKLTALGITDKPFVVASHNGHGH
jgi:hypothetical protein